MAKPKRTTSASALTIERLTRNEIRGLFSRVHRSPTGCWLWTGYRTPKGYARIRFRGHHVAVHRLMFAWLVHALPTWDSQNVLDHRVCDTPACCHPAHLVLTTNRVNVLRGRGLTALNAVKTHCVNGHALTEDNVATRVCRGREYRCCKLCRRDSGKVDTARRRMRVRSMEAKLSPWYRQRASWKARNFRGLRVALTCGHVAIIPSTLFRLMPPVVDAMLTGARRNGVLCEQCESRVPVEKLLGTCLVKPAGSSLESFNG